VADPASASAHFVQRLSVETDADDVASALAAGLRDFHLVDARSHAAYAAASEGSRERGRGALDARAASHRMSRGGAIVLGAVGPLTPPGIAWAGRELLAGMELAVQDVNVEGGSGGRALELLFEDTHGDPSAGVEALGRLHAAGACALVGEFHSVVANALAEKADRMAIPFLCSSATLDAITARRSPYVFRLAPPQSRGWKIYADFLLARGFRQVIEIIREDIYWTSGAEVIRRRLEPTGVRVTRVPVNSGDSALAIAERTCAFAGAESRSIALLLVGYPQPLEAIVRALADRGLLTGALALGDPAGRAIFPDWWATAGEHGATASFLSYQLPGRLTQKGWQAAAAFYERQGREPSFVALEGYDTIAVLAHALERTPDLSAESICAALRAVAAPGARGVVRFAVEPEGAVHHQWAWPPVCVAARGDPGRPLSEADVLWPSKEALKLPNRSLISRAEWLNESG
jgi:ABC-type branched-subunit amino acid transport system substrate-binding protein